MQIKLAKARSHREGAKNAKNNLKDFAPFVSWWFVPLGDL